MAQVFPSCSHLSRRGPTVYRRRCRRLTSTCSCSSQSLSRTSTLVLPLTFLTDARPGRAEAKSYRPDAPVRDACQQAELSPCLRRLLAACVITSG
jgi:hypothetical protein